MASKESKPSRTTRRGMEPPLRETWNQVLQELVKRQQQEEEEQQGLVSGLQASKADQIYTGNSGDRSTGGIGGKTKKKRGWYKWLRKLRAREKNIPSQFYPDMESNMVGMENLTLETQLEDNALYNPATYIGDMAMDGREWMEWRESAQKEKRKGGLSGQRTNAYPGK
uniref:Protein Rev n=1 Tax=Maedi visna virus (strain KV1772) TaxID=36374 RepID=REV_VILVK|nr:RecName: Full=Protein Rev [Visna/maedi virus EV1 KV1772]pir/F45390/ trans-regulatory splicing protein - Maedi/Visna virus (strain KV1772) (provirus) [Visna-maedi virus]AAB25464.1 rev [Visna-maedi virus]